METILGQSGCEEEKEECGREAVLEKIASLAASYTPEWRFDAAHPDAGTALAILFADLFSGTLRRFERISEKHKRAFFEQTGLVMRPALTAGGYVTFGISSDEIGSVFLKKGIAVSGAASGGASDISSGVNVTYRTQEAVCVTPARLTKVLLTDGAKDYIALKDAEGPFFPFGREEENLQEHSFYLCHDEVLSVSGGAEICLALQCPEADDTRPRGWMTGAGECSFLYSAQEGFEEYGERRMEDGRLILRVGEDREPPAERELFGKKGYWLCCRLLKSWHGEPLEADGIRLASRREGMEPDLIWNQTGEQENERLFPFGENPIPFAECYFACGEALGKLGARVVMSFWIDYEKIPFDNSYKVDRRWKLLMKRADFAPDPEYDITVAQVVWEYYNGAGWSRLTAEKGWESMFDGAGARAGQQVRLEFICPPDAALLEWQAAPTRYLRVRALKVTNLYKPRGTYLVPVIGDVHFSYDYGPDGKMPEWVAAVNNREHKAYRVREKCGEPWPIPLFFGQKDERISLYLGFHLPLLKGPVRFLCAMQEEMYGELPLLSYSYSGRDGFLPLSVVDETGNLKKSGTLTFMGKEDFASRTVCGETAYWIRITDEGGGYRAWERQRRMPQIQGIYLNAARVRSDEEQARRLGGMAHNQTPGGIKKLDGSYGYVNRVVNPLPVGGGYDGESVEEALMRGSAALRHRGRAVTASDFEAAAREASRSVRKAVCYPNCNAQGEYEPGAVALVLLLEGFADGSMYFGEVRRQVTERLSEQMSGNLSELGRLYVAEPLFLELDCYVEAVASDSGGVFELQEEIVRTGEAFLHPLTGNYNGLGWDIGVIPNETQVMNALKRCPGLDYIQSLRIMAYRNFGAQRVQVPLGGRDRAESGAAGRQMRMLERFAVPLPGRFEVAVAAR